MVSTNAVDEEVDDGGEVTAASVFCAAAKLIWSHKRPSDSVQPWLGIIL